jgi:ubiquinone biosynthesis protein UbiJ
MLLDLGQRMLNEQIALSTAARERLAGLDGKRFAVIVRGSDLRFVATAAAGRVELEMSLTAESDVELEAGLFDLLRLARSASLSDLKSVDASLNGDIRIAEAFAELMRLAIPEPEALLADWVGDMPAHFVGQAARHTASWGTQAGRAFEQNMAEYLQEEKPTLVPPALARHFSDEVDRIRDDVERAVRRVELLEQRLGGPGPRR